MGDMEIHDIINGCIAIEKAAASIYSTFMQLFPEEKNFWESLCMDEIEHISFLTDADAFGIFNEPQIRIEPPSAQIVGMTLEFAEGLNQRIKLNPVSLENALKMALKLEESMVETYANETIADLLATNKESFDEKMFTYEKLHVDKIRNMMIMYLMVM